MRFMTLYKPGSETDAPPTEREIADMGRLIEDMAKAGVLIAADGLQPSSQGARVRISDGKFTVTDGPFTEAKELVAGYAILQAKSKQEAIELTKRFHQPAVRTGVTCARRGSAIQAGNRPAVTAITASRPRSVHHA